MQLIASDETLRILDFPLVLEGLAGMAQTPMGRQRLLSLTPTADAGALDSAHARVDECRRWLVEKGGVALAEARPIDAALEQAGIGGSVLEPEMLLAVGRTARVARTVRQQLAHEQQELPRLAAIAARVADFEPLISQIAKVLDDEGNVRDDASPALAKLRRRRRQQRKRLLETLDRYVHDDAGDALQERLVTQRGGRYVVPIRADKRGSLPGVVHDSSSSGQTVYVEPLEVVEQQNSLIATDRDEQREVQRLLADLTGHVRAARERLVQAQDAVGELDLLQALGRYAEQADAVRPQFVESEIDIEGARHPLFLDVLHPREDDDTRFVPLDLELPAEKRILVITGPNTGGKTVALKTVGALALLAQCGVPVPARRARLPRCPRVHADIGDDQSIVANLSTFSAHLTRIDSFLRDCPAGSLVLLDELGTGTDPAEGAALGIALVERFAALGAVTLVSTHHDTLKAFAHTHQEAMNAAMEFDSVTLEPTFRLRMGLPGRSNAFEIATRLGLGDELVDRARHLLSTDTLELGSLLRSVESEAEALAAGRQALEQQTEDLQQARERSIRDARDLAELRNRLVEEAEELVRDQSAQLRRRGEELLAELETELGEASSARAAADRRARWAARTSALKSTALNEIGSRLGDVSFHHHGEALAEHEADEPKRLEAIEEDIDGPLSRGDRVVVLPLNVKGTVGRDWNPSAGADESVEVDVRGKRLLVGRDHVRRLR